MRVPTPLVVDGASSPGCALLRSASAPIRIVLLGCALLGPLLARLAVASPLAETFEDRVESYEKQKRENLLARTPRPRRGRAPELVTRDLAPLLARLLEHDGRAGLRFVRGEYGEARPDLVVAAGRALLGHPSDECLRAAIAGFGRGQGWTVGARATLLDAFAASRRELAWQTVVRLAEGSDTELRLLALGSLNQNPGGAGALEAMLASLAHRAAEIRRAALRALKLLASHRSERDRSMIPALIERIGEERDERLKKDVLELLVRTTGLDMGYEVKDWRKWWDAEGERFTFQRETGARTALAAPDLTYFGLEVSSNAIAFLVDASNSMKGNAGGGATKIDVLKKELTGILSKLPETSFVNIIYFNAGANAWKSRLQSLRGRGREEAIDFVNALTLAGKTAIYDALELALADHQVDAIYLLSDGLPIGGKISDPDEILREIGAQNRLRGAKIHTISFGKETEFLQKLAADNDGEYRSTKPKSKPKAGAAKRDRKPARKNDGEEKPAATNTPALVR